MSRRNYRRSGSMLVYLTILITLLLAFASLAVDLGRAQLAKTELQRAADAAARYGAQGFANSTVSTKAIAAAADNTVDGTALVLQAGDITSGVWRSGAFYTSGTGTSAVRVIAHRAQSRGTGIPLIFAKALGRSYVDISATSVATYVAPLTVTLNPGAGDNPWLAGMPNGTTANSFDAAPANSPSQVTGVPITPGDKLQFDFSGAVSYLPGKGATGPDGDMSRMIFNCCYDSFAAGREHGMANLTAPITGVVAVFLNDSQPDTQGAPPADLDFSTGASRDFASLSPALRQPFYIGDGLRNDGVTVQDFVVPAGATRLFIGVMDGQQWSDNSGSFTTNVTSDASVKMVK